MMSSVMELATTSSSQENGRESEPNNERLDLNDPTVAADLSLPAETLFRAALSLRDQVRTCVFLTNLKFFFLKKSINK